jgi:hypothetical protein
VQVIIHAGQHADGIKKRIAASGATLRAPDRRNVCLQFLETIVQRILALLEQHDGRPRDGGHGRKCKREE